MIGAQGGGRRAIGEQVELVNADLRFTLDPVLDRTPGARELLVEGAGIDRAGRKRGDEEARVRPLAQGLGLGDDAPILAPAVQRAPENASKAARGAARGQALQLGCGQIGSGRAAQARVAGEAEEVIDPVRLAPRHQLVAGKARVGTQQDLHPATGVGAPVAPAGPDLSDDAGDLVNGASRGIAVGTPQLGRQQMAAAEHVQRQVAGAVPPVGPWAAGGQAL